MGAISLTGKGTTTVSAQPLNPYAQKNELSITLKNEGPANAFVQRLDLMLTTAGGWVWSIADLTQEGLIDGDTPAHVLDTGTTFKPGQSRTYVFNKDGPYAVAVFRIASGGAAEEWIQVPLARAGYAVPAPIPATGPVFVGFWHRPMEIVDVWRAGKVARWLAVGGMLFNGTYDKLTAKSVAVKVSVDGKAILEEKKPPNFLDWYGVAQSGPAQSNPDGSMLLATAVSPFVYGFDLTKLPAKFQKAELTVTVTYAAPAGGDQKATATVPVRRAKALTLHPPVKGGWFWGSSADAAGFDAHTWPHQYLAADLSIWKDNSSHLPKETPKNEDFYAYGQPAIAAAAGPVFQADDSSNENDGYQQLGTGTNFVLVQHDGGYSGYVHLRKGKDKVKAGDKVFAGAQLGEVGNSGGSSEPHLHFAFVTEDETGRARIRPVRFLLLADENKKPASATPGSGTYFAYKKPPNKKKWAPKDPKKPSKRKKPPQKKPVRKKKQHSRKRSSARRR
jgi:murein DD-endopeptidase MepM/ murein hydrolase activator NlpD